MLIQTILGATIAGSIAGIYNILKNSEETEEEILIDNIIKYEYFPVEMHDILEDKNMIRYQYIEGEKEDRYICKCEFCDNEFTKWKQEEKEED